jgi:hypothetical protein
VALARVWNLCREKEVKGGCWIFCWARMEVTIIFYFECVCRSCVHLEMDGTTRNTIK